MLMISPLNWIEPTLTFSKEENVLVLLKCQDLFIEYSINPAYLALSCLGSEFQHYALNGLWISTPIPIQAMDWINSQ